MEMPEIQRAIRVLINTRSTCPTFAAEAHAMLQDLGSRDVRIEDTLTSVLKSPATPFERYLKEKMK